MSRFTDYAAKMRQVQTPFTGGLQSYVRQQNDMKQQSPLYNQQKFYGLTPQAQTPAPVNTDNTIGALAEMLGPTPEEREAAERRMIEQRGKMAAWTGLFDGLRQLGNLYYTAKGAVPQQLTDMQPQVEQQYQQQRAMYDDMANYRRQYATSLYNLKRQMDEDKRKDMLAKAQASYYGTRDEVARGKAENDRQKNEKNIELQDGRIAKLDAETGRIKVMTPYQVREAQSRINRNDAAAARTNKQADLIGEDVTYITTSPDPDKNKTVVKKVGSGGNSDNTKKKIKGYTKSAATGNNGNKGKKGKAY